MNRIFVWSLAAVLMLSVVCAAGCVDNQVQNDPVSVDVHYDDGTTADEPVTSPVIGNWFYADDKLAGKLTFTEAGTGKFSGYLLKSENSGVKNYVLLENTAFFWTTNGFNSYTMSYTDGVIDYGTYNPQTGEFDLLGAKYRKDENVLRPNDPVIGSWNWQDDTMSVTVSFDSTGSGKYTGYLLGSSNGRTVNKELADAWDFTWETNGDGIYVLFYDTGDIAHAHINVGSGLLYIDGIEFTKKSNASSR